MDIQFLDIANVLTTAIAGAIGWLIGIKKQKNDYDIGKQTREPFYWR